MWACRDQVNLLFQVSVKHFHVSNALVADAILTNRLSEGRFYPCVPRDQ